MDRKRSIKPMSDCSKPHSLNKLTFKSKESKYIRGDG